MTENALKCKYNGGTLPLGYVIDSDQHFQTDPLTAPFVLDAFKRYDEGATMTQIRDWLNEIVSMLMDLQSRENSSLPLYEKELQDVEAAINNMLNAIQQGIFSKFTKARLDELDATKDELEERIACENPEIPKLTAKQMTFWLHRFRKLDVSKRNTGKCSSTPLRVRFSSTTIMLC